MDPTHASLLVPLLQRSTLMPVREAVHARPIEARTVYVIPPGAELTVLGGTLQVRPPSEPRGQRRPVDALFLSLAREHGPRAAGVVLSGMGDDGALGLQAIRAHGGATAVQQPESAQFDAMPRSALAAGEVDVVAPAAELPSRLLTLTAALPPADLAPGAALASDGYSDSDSDSDSDAGLSTILALLHQHTGHELALYKTNTLERRIARRMAVHGLGTMAAYADLLRGQLQERDLLFKEMLIGVTAFFRDPLVWQDLQDRVLPALIAQHTGQADRDDGAPTRRSGPLRAWVPGCSTGEEAYSLAMAFVEALDAMPPADRPDLQIFATDLNADAIAAARSGRFPKAVAHGLTPQRLARFFTERPDGYQIDPRVRELVLFAQHDLLTDPPFTRLDVITCRNLLIYFSSALQRRLIPLFHYSLRPGGALMLGSSETVGRAQSLFQPLDPKSRIYWRRDTGAAGDGLVFPTHRRATPRSPTLESVLTPNSTPPANLQSLADQLLLQSHAPAAVLVTDAGDVVYINGRTGRYLEPAAGKANWNLHVMARPSIRAQLAVALRAALQDKKSIELRGLRLDDEGSAAVDITVQGIVQPKALAGMAMVVFRDVPVGADERGRRADAAGLADPDLAAALLQSREEIQALRQEMRASQEELQAANEELQSTNEELQSANEELTTSKEEGQSMNEELQTINGELQSKLDDLALAQSDMQNLLNSTDIATLFLDQALNVRRFTDQIGRVIHLREGDIGRPLSELASTLIYPELHADVQETLRTLAFSEKQIATTDGLWFTVRVMPYRTLANVIQGVVITFVDITAAKALEARLRGD